MISIVRYAVFGALLGVPGWTTAAQTPSARPAEQAADSSAVGTYEFSFVPRNGEPITGRLVISRVAGRYRGVVTSPKLSEPLDADSVGVAGSHVFTSMLDGMYTFTFDVALPVRGATFTKTMRGETESGDLTIRKVPR